MCTFRRRKFLSHLKILCVGVISYFANFIMGRFIFFPSNSTICSQVNNSKITQTRIFMGEMRTIVTIQNCLSFCAVDLWMAEGQFANEFQLV